MDAPDIPRGSIVSVQQPGATTPRYYKAPHFLGVFHWTRENPDSPWEPTSGILKWDRVRANKDAVPLDPPDA